MSLLTTLLDLDPNLEFFIFSPPLIFLTSFETSDIYASNGSNSPSPSSPLTPLASTSSSSSSRLHFLTSLDFASSSFSLPAAVSISFFFFSALHFSIRSLLRTISSSSLACSLSLSTFLCSVSMSGSWLFPLESESLALLSLSLFLSFLLLDRFFSFFLYSLSLLLDLFFFSLTLSGLREELLLRLSFPIFFVYKHSYGLLFNTQLS